MSKSNHPFQVLVTAGDSAIAVAGTTLAALVASGTGKIGIFNADTNLAVTASGPSKIFIASTYTDAAGTVKLRKSAGQNIQVKGLTSLAKQKAVVGRDQVITITPSVGTVGTEYVVNINFKNSEILNTIGYLNFSESYRYIATAATVKNVIDGLVAAINANSKGLVTAVNSSDTALILTSIPAAINTYTQINLKYNSPRQTTMTVALTEGFVIADTVVETVSAIYAQGLGYDVKQREYEAYGWNSGTNRVDASGMPNGDLGYVAITGTSYDQIALTYLNQSPAGRREDFDAGTTYIAIPTGGTTTFSALEAALESILGVTASGDATFTVSAGVDQSTVTGDTATLAGTTSATTGLYTVLWTRVVGGGAGTVVFDDATSLTPTISGIDTNGAYTLQLAVTQDGVTVTDTVVVTTTT